MNQNTTRDIAVIGIACHFPKSENKESYWDNLINGIDCTTLSSRFSKKFQGGYIDEIEYFDANFFNIPPAEAVALDPRQRLFLQTAYHALEDAGYGGDKLYGKRVGTFVGAANNQYVLRLDRAGYQQNRAIDNANASIANRFSFFMNFKGPSLTVDSTCSSSSLAIHMACNSIRGGECELALCGGVHLLLSENSLNALKQMAVLSDSDKNCAYSRNANGFLPGEGIGVLLLKPLNKALDDKDYIYAVLKTSVVNYAGKTKGLLSPNPVSQTGLFIQAIEKNAINLDSLQYIEMNGASTVTGDFQEVQSILSAYSKYKIDKQTICFFGTVKNNIGNLDAASGVASIIKVILSLKHGYIPPVIHTTPLNRFLNLENTALALPLESCAFRATQSPVLASVNSFGIGGTNVILIIGQVPEEQTNEGTASGLLTLSGETRTSLIRNISLLAEKIETDNQVSVNNICYTCNTGRGHFKHRTFVTFKNKSELLSTLREKVRAITSEMHTAFPVELNINNPRKQIKKTNLKNFFKQMKKQKTSDIENEAEYIEPFYSKQTPPSLFLYCAHHPSSPDRRKLFESGQYTKIFTYYYRKIVSVVKKSLLQQTGQENLMDGFQDFFYNYAYYKTLFSLIKQPFGILTDKPSLPFTLLLLKLISIGDFISGQLSPETDSYNIMETEYSGLKKVLDQKICLIDTSLVDSLSLADNKLKQLHIISLYKNVTDWINHCQPAILVAAQQDFNINGNEQLTIIDPLSENSDGDNNCFQQLLGELYLNYVILDWDKYEQQFAGRLVPLPLYYYDKKYFWIDQFPGNTQQDTKIISEKTMKPLNNINNLEDFFLNQICQKYGYEKTEIDPDAALSVYGIDSLFFISMFNLLREIIGIDIDQSELFRFTTIRELCHFLYEQYPDELANYSKNPMQKAGTVNNQSIQQESPVSYKEINNPDKTKPDDIAVIGMAARLPQADDVDAFWENLLAGINCIREIPPARWKVEDYYDPDPQKPGKTCSKWAGIVDDIDKFDAAFFNINTREAGTMDPQQRMILQEVWNAMENGAIHFNELEGKDVGVFIGVSNFEYNMEITSKPIIKILPHESLGSSHSLIANRVSHFFKFSGPSYAVDSTCSSSLVALHQACVSLQTGECEMAIVAGVNLAYAVRTFITISKTGMLSPSGICRIFDKSSDGTTRGEGCGVVILRPKNKAEQAGNIIHGLIKGTAVRYKGQSMGIMLPSVSGIRDVMLKAWERNGIKGGSLDYLEVGSLGSIVADPIEMNAIQSVLGEGRAENNPCLLGSLKPVIGHLEAASGIAGLIKALMILKNNTVPPMLNFQELNPAIKLNKQIVMINTENYKLQTSTNTPLRVGINSLGFGGTIAHTVVEKYLVHYYHTSTNVEEYTQTHEQKKEIEDTPGLYCFSAKSAYSFKQKLVEFNNWLISNKKPLTPDIDYTLNKYRTHFPEYRIIFLAKSKKELQQQLSGIIMQFNNDQQHINIYKPEKSNKDFTVLLNLLDIYATTPEKINDTHMADLLADKDFDLFIQNVKIDADKSFCIPAYLAGYLYLQGVTPDWEKYYGKNDYRRVEMPVYPFSKKSFWVQK
ncbi:MAG: hypothetical protein JXB88_13820 [Spirochaetales bacterium]|nr:hypothetical protein [Spirochaetales bacterium]